MDENGSKSEERLFNWRVMDAAAGKPVGTAQHQLFVLSLWKITSSINQETLCFVNSSLPFVHFSKK